MAIYCMQCGKELPDDAKFCLKCGKQVGGMVQPVAQAEPKWEYCEIVYTVKPSPKNNNRSLSDKMTGSWWHDIVFIADGVGPQGAFDATQGNEFRGYTFYSFNRDSKDEYMYSNHAEDEMAVKRLIGYLTQQGWEPLPGKGNAWFSHKFRRKVSPISQAEMSPKTYLEWLSKGDALRKLERYEEALPAYDQALRLNPKSGLAYWQKGDVLRELKRYEEAVAAYDQALRLDPNNAWPYQRKGDVLRELKRYEEAVAAYDQVLRLDPNNAWAYRDKGDLLRELKRYEEALEAWNQALRLDPNNALIYDNRGLILFNLKRYDEALAAFDQALRLDPNDAVAYYGKGTVLRDLKRTEEAQAAFDVAKRLNPKLSQ